METRKSKEFLKCVLTEAEKRLLSDKMAIAVMNKSEHEGKLKSAQTQIKSDIARCDADIISCAEKLRSGFEMRDVDCETTFQLSTGTAILTRLDTGEIVKERAMTAEERQAKLF